MKQPLKKATNSNCDLSVNERFNESKIENYVIKFVDSKGIVV